MRINKRATQRRINYLEEHTAIMLCRHFTSFLKTILHNDPRTDKQQTIASIKYQERLYEITPSAKLCLFISHYCYTATNLYNKPPTGQAHPNPLPVVESDHRTYNAAAQFHMNCCKLCRVFCFSHSCYVLYVIAGKTFRHTFRRIQWFYFFFYYFLHCSLILKTSKL